MTTLVTGATGFIGRRLLSPGVRAMVRTPPVPAHGVLGDLLEPSSLIAACEGVEAVFHCAGYAHALTSSDPEAHWRINFEGTRHLVRAAVEAGVARFVFLSSVKAMADPGDECVDEDWPGEPDTPYGKAKRAAEEVVLEAGARHGLHAVCLRLAMVYGPGGRGNLERMARGIRAGWFPPLPETHNRRSLVHVDDVVAAMRLVAERPEASGKTYIVAHAQPYSGRAMYDAVRAALRRPAVSSSLPASLLRAGGRLGSLAESILRRPLPLNTEVVSRVLDSACYSPARIERELGWSARIGLEDGLREMLAEHACGINGRA